LGSIAVITGIFGDYDDVPPIPTGFDDAVLVSDKPIRSPWRNVVVERIGSPRLASKLPKFRPDLFTSCRSSVWVDASMRDEQNWLRGAVGMKLLTNDLVFFRHPERSTVLEELIASLELDKYRDQPLLEQVHNYQLRGFRDDLGLWAGGVIARNHNSRNVEFGEAWLTENKKWSIQDQISLPFVIWNLELSPGNFEEDQYAGPVKWIQHKGEFRELALQKRTRKKFRSKINTLVRLSKERNYSIIWFLIKKKALRI